MDATLSAAADRAERQFPNAARLVRDLDRVGRIVSGPIRWLLEHRSAEFWSRAEQLAELSRGLGGSPAEALAEYTVMFLREQMAFQKTGRYSNTDFDEVRKAVYDNPEVMERFYLEGLMLTHAFWPIHFDIHTLFSGPFVDRVPDAGQGFEVGFGHGLYLLEVLTRRPGTRTTSFDISPYARAFAARVLAFGHVAADRFDLRFADVREALPLESASQQWAVFAEVLEHIPDPAHALREVRRCLSPGAPLFATTVLDSNAIDHLYQFESAEEVRGLLTGEGFEIHEEHVLKVADYGAATKDPTVDLVYVCTRTGE